MKNLILLFTAAISVIACEKKNPKPTTNAIGYVLSGQEELGMTTSGTTTYWKHGYFLVHGKQYPNNSRITDKFVIGDSVCWIDSNEVFTRVYTFKYSTTGTYYGYSMVDFDGDGIFNKTGLPGINPKITTEGDTMFVFG
jgi:hypothetical protein